MPFRTRKQKEAASTRRLIFVKKALVTYPQDKLETSATESPVKVKTVTANLPDRDYFYVKWDLLKIAILAVLIVTGQILFKIFF